MSTEFKFGMLCSELNHKKPYAHKGVESVDI
jgi:hypothetical protein